MFKKLDLIILLIFKITESISNNQYSFFMIIIRR